MLMYYNSFISYEYLGSFDFDACLCRFRYTCIDTRLMFLIIFLLDMHLGGFLCASLDQCNFLGLRRQKSSLISKLNLQNLAILTAKCGKFVNF